MFHEADMWLVVSDDTIRMYVQIVTVVPGILKASILNRDRDHLNA